MLSSGLLVCRVTTMGEETGSATRHPGVILGGLVVPKVEVNRGEEAEGNA
jgi:hypothetical protein